jgi:mannitol/fructose-specific phosphotransferase system IIA component (Ntr-type)
MAREPDVAMNLDDLFGPKPVVLNLQAKDHWEAIDELIGHLVTTRKIKTEHKDAIVAAVKKRESSMSTGVGSGIGMPHAMTDLISEAIWALGGSKNGIQFDAMDGRPVEMVILFLIPQGQFQKHLHTLAEIAKLLHNAEFRAELRRRFL